MHSEAANGSWRWYFVNIKKVFSNLGPMLLDVGVWMNGKVVLFK